MIQIKDSRLFFSVARKFARFLYMKVGQHYYSTTSIIRTRASGAPTGVQSGPITTILKISEKIFPLQKLSQDWSKVIRHSEKSHQLLSMHEICRPQENT